MKPIYFCFCLALFALGSCHNDASGLENRVAELEKTVKMQSDQIKGLGVFAYTTSVDTTGVEDDSLNVAAMIFSAYNSHTAEDCELKCSRQFRINYLRCENSPNKTKCRRAAANLLSRCLSGCHSH